MKENCTPHKSNKLNQYGYDDDEIAFSKVCISDIGFGRTIYDGDEVVGFVVSLPISRVW